jgi:hypothetical protein
MNLDLDTTVCVALVLAVHALLAVFQDRGQEAPGKRAETQRLPEKLSFRTKSLSTKSPSFRTKSLFISPLSGTN